MALEAIFINLETNGIYLSGELELSILGDIDSWSTLSSKCLAIIEWCMAKPCPQIIFYVNPVSYKEKDMQEASWRAFRLPVSHNLTLAL